MPPRSPIRARFRAVRQGQVVGRPHFEQARRRAGEFESLRAVRAGEQGLRLGGGRRHQLHPHVVERVDQDDEPLGRVALVRSQHGDAVDEHGMEALGDLQVVGRAEGLSAEVVEAEAGDSAGRLRHVEPPAQQFDLDRRAAPDPGQRQECGVERGVGLGSERRIIDRGADELFQPVVGPRVEFGDLAARLEKRDERQEEGAVEPVPVEIVRGDVRGRHHDDARGEERGEQPPEDHRVGDVAHREFVEAEERRLAREFGGDRGDRVLARHRSALARLSPLVQAGVDVGHEGVEVGAALLRDVDRREEQVHQHGLAAPDRAVNVEPARRLGRLRAEQAREGAGLRVRPVAAEPVTERVELFDKVRLGGIGGDLARVDQRAVTVGERSHAFVQKDVIASEAKQSASRPNGSLRRLRSSATARPGLRSPPQPRPEERRRRRRVSKDGPARTVRAFWRVLRDARFAGSSGRGIWDKADSRTVTLLAMLHRAHPNAPLPSSAPPERRPGAARAA